MGIGKLRSLVGSANISYIAIGSTKHIQFNNLFIAGLIIIQKMNKKVTEN
jgi:hypothetical protein